MSNTNLTFNKGIWRPVCKENVYWYLVGLVLKYELMCIFIYTGNIKYKHIHTHNPPSLSLTFLCGWAANAFLSFPFFPQWLCIYWINVARHSLRALIQRNVSYVYFIFINISKSLYKKYSQTRTSDKLNFLFSYQLSPPIPLPHLS